MSKFKSLRIHKRGLFKVIISTIFLVAAGWVVYRKPESWLIISVLTVLAIIAVLVLSKLTRRYREDYRLMACGIIQIDQMPGEQFEEYMLIYFKTLGYEGHLTRISGDFGADIVLEKNGEKIVVQAKRWSSPVGISAVQQVVGAIKHYNAKYGMVVTTNYFSNNAKTLAKSNGIILWDRDYILHNTSKVPLLNKLTEISGVANCPICKSKLIQEKWKKGHIIHCEKYPDCRYIKTL